METGEIIGLKDLSSFIFILLLNRTGRPPAPLRSLYSKALKAILSQIKRVNMRRLFLLDEKAEWEVEFDRYKAFPEWQQRRSMTMDEFKHIFFWEVRRRDENKYQVSNNNWFNFTVF